MNNVKLIVYVIKALYNDATSLDLISICDIKN